MQIPGSGNCQSALLRMSPAARARALGMRPSELVVTTTSVQLVPAEPEPEPEPEQKRKPPSSPKPRPHDSTGHQSPPLDAETAVDVTTLPPLEDVAGAVCGHLCCGVDKLYAATDDAYVARGGRCWINVRRVFVEVALRIGHYKEDVRVYLGRKHVRQPKRETVTASTIATDNAVEAVVKLLNGQ